MKIVVVGSQGTLGNALTKFWNDPKVARRLAERTGEALQTKRDEIVPLNLPDFDACSRMHVLATLDAIRPDVIVNAAGVNKIDWLQSRANTARNLHEHAVSNLKAAATQSHALLVQFSCAEIFYRNRLEHGVQDERAVASTTELARKSTPTFDSPELTDLPVDPCAPGFHEYHVPNPASVYAKTKLESERVAAEAQDSLILRFSSLFGDSTPFSSGNLIESSLNAFRRASTLSVLNDVVAEPVWTIDLVCALKSALSLNVRGLLHLTGNSRATPLETIQYVIERTRVRGKNAVGISLADYGVSAPHSHFKVLTSQRASDYPGLYTIPTWREALNDFFKWREVQLDF